MGSEWMRVPVSEVANAVIGGTPSRNVPDYWNGDIPWASAKDVATVPSRYLDKVQESITEQGLQSSAAKLMPRGTVVITARGTVGALAQLGQDMAFNQTCYAMIPSDRIDETFLFYALKGTLPAMRVLTYGTVFDTITRRTFENWEIPLPPLPEQRAIAHILGTLDDKIELNRRLNQTLEAMARAIFQDWFVDFGPVRAKLAGQEPYLPPELWALFPDRLAATELGEAPEGWGVKALSSFGDVITGKTPSTRNPQFYGSDMPFLKIPDMRGKVYAVKTETMLSNAGAASQKGKTLPVGSISVSCIATPGLVVLNHRETQTNQQINSIVPNDGKTSRYLYWSCRTLASEIMLGGSGGSVFHNMNKSTFGALAILDARLQVYHSFDELISPIHELILSKEIQSQHLAALRDTLLPRLVSGEIKA